MSNRTQIYELAKKYVPGAADDLTGERTIYINAPTLRPRIEGREPTLRDQATAAFLADRATVTFLIRPSAPGAFLGNQCSGIGDLFGYLTVRQYAVLGGNDDAGFPQIERDVSGILNASGSISVDVDVTGVCMVMLRTGYVPDPTQFAVPSVPLWITTQIYGNERVLDRHAELLTLNPKEA